MPEAEYVVKTIFALGVPTDSRSLLASIFKNKTLYYPTVRSSADTLQRRASGAPAPAVLLWENEATPERIRELSDTGVPLFVGRFGPVQIQDGDGMRPVCIRIAPVSLENSTVPLGFFDEESLAAGRDDEACVAGGENVLQAMSAAAIGLANYGRKGLVSLPAPERAGQTHILVVGEDDTELSIRDRFANLLRILSQTRAANPEAHISVVSNIQASVGALDQFEPELTRLADAVRFAPLTPVFLGSVDLMATTDTTAAQEATMRGIALASVRPIQADVWPAPADASVLSTAFLKSLHWFNPCNETPLDRDAAFAMIAQKVEDLAPPARFGGMIIQRKQHLVNRARRVLNFKGAAALVREALESMPEDVDLWQLLGVVLMEAGDPVGAEAAFDTAISLLNSSPELYEQRASARIAQGKMVPETGQDFLRAAELAHENNITYLARYFQFEWERAPVNERILSLYGRAAARYLKTSKSGPESARFLMRYAAMLHEAGCMLQARKIHKQALSRGETDAPFLGLRLAMETQATEANRKPVSKSLRAAYLHMYQNATHFSEMVAKANGDVVIVGNGPQERGKALGAEIDGHEMVVRFNTFCTVYPHSHDYGMKTDLWVRMPPTGYVKADINAPCKTIMLTGSNRLYRETSYWDWISAQIGMGHDLLFMPKEPFYDLLGVLGRIPTAGLVLAYMLYREIGPLSEEHVLGCSFAYPEDADGPYHYADPSAGMAARHAAEGERMFFDTLRRRDDRTYYVPITRTKATPRAQQPAPAMVDPDAAEDLEEQGPWRLDDLDGRFARVLSASPGLEGYRLFDREVEVVSRAEVNAAQGATLEAIRGDKAIFPLLSGIADPPDTLVLGFGLGPTGQLGRGLSKTLGAPYMTVEFGLISSFHLPSEKQYNFSLILDDAGVFYDTVKPSRLEYLLEQGLGAAADELTARARDFTARVVEHRITKYNNADEIVLPPRSTTRRRILVVDQTSGDLSITHGQCERYGFNDMLEHALAQTDAEVLLKPHPETLAGAKGANYDLKTLEGRAHLTIINKPCNILSLITQVDEVYVMTSGVGLEALMAGVPVRCFGVPFYAGRGLTTDMVTPLRPRRAVSIEELVASVFFCCHQFYDPDSRLPVTPEACIDALIPKLQRRHVLLSIGGRLVRYDREDKHERHYIDVEGKAHGTIDGEIARVFIQPGDVVVDAGANVGYTALKYAARDARKVYAFEPVARLFKRIEAIGDDVLRPMHMALGDEDTTAEILLSTGHAQGNSLAPEMAGLFPDVFVDQSEASRETVTVRRLDSVFDDDRLDFMKIDVEGFEMELLRGAANVLDRTPPRAIQIELYDHQVAPVAGMLKTWYPHCWRAVILKKTGKLALLRMGTEPSKRIHRAILPPVYIFTLTDPNTDGMLEA